MRQLVEITPARIVKRVVVPSKLVDAYPGTMEGLRQFIATKYRLDRDDVRDIIKDIFKFITCEIIKHDTKWSIPGFARLVRSQRGNGVAGINISRTHMLRRFELEEDPEDVVDETSLDVEISAAARNYLESL